MNMRVLELFPHACHSRDKQHSVPDHDKSIPAGGEITMNTINRNYSPMSVASLPSNDSASAAHQPSAIKANHQSNAIDFSSPQQLGHLRAGAQHPDTDTSAASPQGDDGMMILNKLVQAIRTILQEFFALLKGSQQGTANPPSNQNPVENSSSPASASIPTTTSLSSTSSTAKPQAEKPFVVQSEPGSNKPVTVQRNTSDTAPDKVARQPMSPQPPTATPHASAVKEPVSPPATQPEVAKATSGSSKGPGADMTDMVGFAKSANTTGGNGGEVVTVHTVDELKKSLEGDKARTIRLGADLSADSKVTMKFGANKTLVGTESGNGLHNIYLASDKTASNDIFQNLNFTHDSRNRANGDMQMFISSGQRYWIDHSTFTGTKDQNPKGLDKLLYVGGTADNVSLTNSKFQNNEYGVILGQPDDSAAAKAAYKGFPRMTIANNSFNNLDVRAPGLMRHGNFDVYNNLIDNFHLGFTATGDATILSQANYFEKGVDVANKPSNSGVLDDYGDAHFKDIGSNVSFIQKSPTTSWTPPYHRDVRTATEAKAYDLANAGAKT